MTIFQKIIRGEIPSHRVYQDDHIFAFLDINPLSRGHTLVVPREPAVTLDQLSDDAAAAIGRALPRLCRAIRQATGCPGFNILQNNGPIAHQAVMHVHFHIIPRFEGEGPGSGLGIGWQAARLDTTQAAELARQISASMP